MALHVPVCLADFFAIKALALVALALVAYLFWMGFMEKLNQRRERQWLEARRRELKEKSAPKP